MSSRIFYNSRSEAIQLGRRVGIGGEGTVYEILGQSDLVAKIYHQTPPPEKAEKLIALSRLGADRLFNLSAWPVDVLRHQSLPAGGGAPDGGANDNIIGFLMKKIGEAEEVHALHSPKSRLQKFPDASWAFLIYVAANIARAVSVIHEHGYVVGDVNPKNILVTRKATVFLLDCDSFQISVDGKTYRCEGGFPEYTPPELHGVTFKDVERNQAHDCFGLAVIIFQLLFLGRHPFSGRFLGVGEMPLERAIREHRFAFGQDAVSRQMQPPPGTLALGAIPASVNELFRRAFLSPHRPPARDWIEPLESLAKSLKKCHLHTGHHFYQGLADCPWCELEMRARIRLFNFGAATNQNRGHFRLDEVWQEIENVATANISQILEPAAGNPFLPLVTTSETAREIATAKRRRVSFALCFAGFAGFLCSFFGGFCFGLILLIAAIAIIRIINGETANLPTKIPSLMHPPPISNDPFIRQIEAARQNAEESLAQLKVRWQQEAGSQRFLAGLRNLHSQKETYQNLARIRQHRLEQLENHAKAAQFDEFLKQFQIADADIEEVNLATKILLRSYGIETAADLSQPRLEQIQTLDEQRAANLRGWRWELARKFVFDPANGVAPQARLAVEREMDELRLKLEHEMSSGAYYLRRIKLDIEEGQRKLQPLMTAAQKSLAQVQKDYEAVTKPVSAKLAILVLIIAFLFGLMADVSSPSSQEYNSSGPQPQLIIETKPAISLEDQQKAMELYLEGLDFLKNNEFEAAANSFQQSIALNSEYSFAQQELGKVLYRLGRYAGSVSATKEAIRLTKNPDLFFGLYYQMGLANRAQNELLYAKDDLMIAVSFIQDGTRWEETHIYAYYLLAEVLQDLNDIDAAITSLENDLRNGTGKPIQRFELANLYLRVGKIEEARQQYRQLKTRNKSLAAALKKLMAKYSIR